MSVAPLARWWRSVRGAGEPVGADEWQRLCAHAPLIGRCAAAEQTRLRQLSGVFLDRKRFEGALGLKIDQATRLQIAAQACVPILGLSLDWLDDWRSVVVYPGDFVARHEVRDEDGVVHESDAALSGEAWSGGPVILSLDRLREDIQGKQWGNLVIHEIAHKLDMRNGAANGMPPLHRDMDRERWTAVWTDTYSSLAADADSGLALWIDEYALEDPAECFAMMSEAFFTCPYDLQRHHAELYDELRCFYRQDPLTRELA